MNRLAALLLAFITPALAAHAAPPRYAVVKVADIYRSLPSTEAFQKSIDQEREDILKNERAQLLRKSLEELQTMQAQLQNKSSNLDENAQRKLAQNFEIKRQEAQTLQQEFESYRAEKNKEINRKIVTEMRRSLDSIVAATQKLAKEKGYDGVFDSSGETNTSVPFVLYQKSSPDLTEEVRALLKDSDAPAKP